MARLRKLTEREARRLADEEGKLVEVTHGSPMGFAGARKRVPPGGFLIVDADTGKYLAARLVERRGT